MADLEQAVAQIRDRIRKYAGEPIGETDTKSVLIDPILRALSGGNTPIPFPYDIGPTISRRSPLPEGGSTASAEQY